MRPTRAGVAVLILLAAAGAAAGPVEALPAAQADPAILARAIHAAGADTRAPEPSLKEWLQAVVDHVVVLVLDLLNPGPRARRLITGGATVLAVVLVAAAAAMLVALLLRTWRQRLQSPAATGDGELLGSAGAEGVAQTAEAWWQAVEENLRAERTPEALAALWWFLATALLGQAVAWSWTTREILQRSGRRDVWPLGRRLDALTYSSGRATPADVRRLASELKGLVA
jgi:hypothetical protein